VGGAPRARESLDSTTRLRDDRVMRRPERDEAAEYYFRYIDQVAGTDDICATLNAQSADVLAVWRAIPDGLSRHRYAPGKWSIRELLGHINDTERLFVSRAFWFARCFDTPLPSFEQQIAVDASGADGRSWSTHVDEFTTVRAATLSFFRNLPESAWSSRGVASGNPFTVRALAFIAAGHVNHHMRVLRERYL